MKDNIKNIMRINALKVMMCAVTLSSATVAMAQDDLSDDLQAAETQQKTPKRKVVESKYPTVQLQGKVIDYATKRPVAGVQIHPLNNNNYAAMTDAEGKFTINVPTFVTSLYVKAPHYSAQQVSVIAGMDGQSIDIKLISDVFQERYGDGTDYTAKNSFTATGDAVTIDNEISEKLGADMRTILHSGAQETGATMLIRGLNSLNMDSQPLVIIDGVEYDMQRDATMLHTGSFFNMLSAISPEDIDKVTVLKNATALYGARGANGVILIDTKRGHSMATRIDAKVSVGIQQKPTALSLMDADQFRSYAQEMLGTIESVQTSSASGKIIDYNFLKDDPNGYYYNIYHNNTDWQKEVYRTALTQNYSVNVQGGDNVGMYNLSVGYVKANRTVKETDFDRINVRFNTDITILEKLKTKFDMSFSRTNSNVFDDGIPTNLSAGTITSPTFLATIKSPLVTPYQYNANVNGFTSLLSEADEIFSQVSSQYSLANPVSILENGVADNKNKLENTHFNVQVAPTFQFNKNLKATTVFCYYLNRYSQKYYRQYAGVPSFKIDELGTVTAKTASLFSKETNITSNTFVEWNKNYGMHDVNVKGGFRYKYLSYDVNDLETQYTAATGNDKNPELSVSSSVYPEVAGDNNTYKNLQWYVNGDYAFMNKYFVTLSLLAESNSRFGKNTDAGVKAFGTQWAIFPSVQLGWVMSNENWFPKNVFINYLRFNAGFDVSGNDGLSNSLTRSYYSSVRYNYNMIGAQLTNIGNDALKWETTQKWNVGFQTYMLNNRLGFNMDFYVHNTSDAITYMTFSNPVGGNTSYWTNGGKIQNAGFEMGVNVKPIVTKEWNLEVGLSLGHYINKVKELPARVVADGEMQFSDGTYVSSVYGTNNIITSVGNPVGLFYGYETAGVFSTEDDASKAYNGTDYLKYKSSTGEDLYFNAGDVRFVDKNGDGYIDERDKTVIGNPNPDIYGNIFASLNWRRFTLDLGFNYCIGNDIYNYQRSVLNSGSALYNQQVAEVGRWTTEGQITDIPKLAFGDPKGNNRFSDRWIEDGSYLRMKNVRLTYRIPIPESWQSWLQGLTVWGEAQNVFTITKYTGIDPEFSAGNGVLYQGIDCGNIAQSRSFLFGLKINL